MEVRQRESERSFGFPRGLCPSLAALLGRKIAHFLGRLADSFVSHRQVVFRLIQFRDLERFDGCGFGNELLDGKPALAI